MTTTAIDAVVGFALCLLGLSSVSPGARPADPRSEKEALTPVRRGIEHDDLTIQRALEVLGQPLNPIKVIGAAQIRDMYGRLAGASPPATGLNAFRVRDTSGDPHIYVNEESSVYRTAAANRSPLALLKLAATLVHEQVHDTDDELAAYRIQSDFVRSRLSGLQQQRDAGHAYLQTLDAKAQAVAHVTRRQRERKR